MCGVYVGVCSLDLKECGGGLGNGGVVVVGVFDVEEDEPFVKHTGKETGMADHFVGHTEVGKIGNYELVFHVVIG